MKRMNKKAQWQNYLLPAILAVLVLGISFYFIFNEIFVGDDLDWEVCKQSIIVRGALPDQDLPGFEINTFKDNFPLKCKTSVIEVTKDDIMLDENDKRNVDKIIGDALTRCWVTFANGDAGIFPPDFYGKTTMCIPCARIHLTKEAKKAVMDDKDLEGRIDIEGLLNGEKFDGRFFYLNYMRGVGQLFDPFNPAFNNPFNLSGEKFEVGDLGDNNIKRIRDGSEIEMEGKFADVSLPKYFNVSRGDLVITLGQLTDSGRDSSANYISYMFYFQNGQSDYMEEMKNQFYDGWTNIADNICNAWEGIPA